MNSDNKKPEWGTAEGIAALSTIALEYARKLIDELTTENAAMREIVQAVANLQPRVAWGSEYREVCGVCWGHQAPPMAENDWDEEAPIVHEPGCPVTKARALVEQAE